MSNLDRQGKNRLTQTVDGWVVSRFHALAYQRCDFPAKFSTYPWRHVVDPNVNLMLFVKPYMLVYFLLHPFYSIAIEDTSHIGGQLQALYEEGPDFIGYNKTGTAYTNEETRVNRAPT